MIKKEPKLGKLLASVPSLGSFSDEKSYAKSSGPDF